MDHVTNRATTSESGRPLRLIAFLMVLLGGVLLAVGLFTGAFQGLLGFLFFTYQLLVVVAIAYLAKALSDVRRELAARH